MFTVLREMYGQRNSSGAYVYFNKHGSKCNLDKFNGLKYVLQFWHNCCFKAFVSLNIQNLVSRSQQNACRFYAKCPLVSVDFNKFVMSQRITVNIRNIQIHNNAFSISTVVT